MKLNINLDLDNFEDKRWYQTAQDAEKYKDAMAVFVELLNNTESGVCPGDNPSDENAIPISDDQRFILLRLRHLLLEHLKVLNLNPFD